MDSPDKRALLSDLAKPRFKLGQLEERWRLIEVDWPHAHIAVRARDGREYNLRFECTGYPQSPPTAGPLDREKNAVLAFDQWPKGSGGRVAAVFKTDWKSGIALYLPCDREAIAGHDSWKTDMPSKIWRPTEGIVQYLEMVHELLHSGDYQPPSGAAA
jgi:hypothetical protein